jgi:Cdc6-like AAA superfamily ATPase
VNPAFHDEMAAGYALSQPGLILGGPMLDDEVVADVKVQVALSMISRHGLIAGATGTGKTTTLKVMAAELSDAGVPVFISDIKGDVTGIAAANDPTNPNIQRPVAALTARPATTASTSQVAKCFPKPLGPSRKYPAMITTTPNAASTNAAAV